MGRVCYAFKAFYLKGQKQAVEAVSHNSQNLGEARLANIIHYCIQFLLAAWFSKVLKSSDICWNVQRSAEINFPWLIFIRAVPIQKLRGTSPFDLSKSSFSQGSNLGMPTWSQE